jgi:uncharacterized repeat protein (TIGR01451 family)
VWLLVALLSLLCVAQTARAADDTIYGVNFNSTPRVLTINPATGVATAVGTLSFGSAAAAVDPVTGRIYYTEYNPGGTSAGRVAYWNPATATNTIINNVGFGEQIPRLAFSSNGTLYGMDADNVLYTINTTNGQFTTLGTVTGVTPTSGGDLAFSPNGTLYLLAAGILYTINIPSLTASTVLNTGIASPTGLTFANNSILYASDLALNANMYTINLSTGVTAPTSSLAGTLVDDLTSFPKFADLSITKAASSSFIVGTTATYTLTVNNAGPQSAGANITVSDTLPTGLTFNSYTATGWTCSAAGQVVTCTRNTAMNAGTSSVITLTVNVLAAASPSVNNTATVDSPTFDPDTTDNSSTVSTSATVPPDLRITKTHTGNFTQGQTNATYTLTVTNNAGAGPTVGTVTVTDTLPAGMTFVSGIGTGWTSCTAAGQVVTCTRATTLNGGASYPAITLTVNVSSTAAASVTNSVTVAVGGELNTGNNSATDITAINAAPDLTINKSHTGNFTQGQTNATYTLTVSNIGRAASTGVVTVTDTLPAGLTFVSGTGTGWTACTAVGQVVTCTRNTSVAALSSFPAITLTVNVSATAPASVTNSVTVTGGGQTNNTNDSDTDDTTINQLADLTINKSHTGNFTQGQTNATYTLNVTNSGNGPTTGTITVTDTLPAGLTFVSGTGTNWNACTAAGQTVTCTRTVALAASASSAITLTVNVASNAPASVTNTAAVSGGGEIIVNNNSDSDPTTINGLPDLTITKSHTGNFTQGQTNATYTLTVTNSGTGPTSGTVTVTDTLPAGLTFVSGIGTGWTSCTAVGQVVTCTRADALLASSSYPVITLTVNVSATAASSVTNNVSVSGGGESNTGNNSASDPTTITQVADLTITKSHTGNFTQGQSGATYTLTVTNSGAGSTVGVVTVTDTLPTGLTFASNGGTGWGSCSAVGQVVTCSRNTVLGPGGSYPALTINVNVASNAPFNVTNSVAVSGGGQANTANDTATDPTTINGVPDLTITKSHTGNFTQGQNGATYTITVTNSGTGATSGAVTVTDTLPAGLTFVSAAPAAWGCSAVGQDVTCSRSDALAAGSSYTAITITVNVSATAPASVTNTASVSGGGETNSGNNSASDPTTINAVADLTVVKSHTGNFTRGSTGVYTLTVTNSGSGISTGLVTITDTLPAGLSFVSNGGTGWGSCSVVGQVITCSRNTVLNAGASYPALTITVSVAQSAASSVTNNVSVSGGGQVVTTNDTATDPTTIVSSADLSLTKVTNNSGSGIGTNATFTITLTNSGPSDATGVAVRDQLPAGLTYMSSTPSVGSYSSVTGIWTVGNLASGAAPVTLQIVARIDALGSITNTAQVSASNQPDPDSTPNNNNAAEDDQASSSLSTSPPSVTLCKTVQGQPCPPVGQLNMPPGSDITYVITFTNSGGSFASSFVITDPIPANTDIKVGSESHSSPLPTGLTGVTVEYFHSPSSTWITNPVSGGGGAPAGYNRDITSIRWTFNGNLSQLAPNNTGFVSFTVRIR